MRDRDASFTIGHRRRVMRLTVFAALLAVLTCAPGAMALDQIVEAVAIDTAVTTDTTAVATTVVDPAPAPVEPAPVAAEPLVAEPVVTAVPPPPPPPDPVAVTEPAAAPPVQPVPGATPSAVTEPTPAAPQEIIIAVLDAPAVVVGADGPAITVSGSDLGSVMPSGDQIDPSALAAPLTIATSTASPSVKSATDTSIITPLVVPIVQTLGSGLLSPYVRPETFGPQAALDGAAASTATAAPRPMPTHPPAQATHVAADLPFGFAAPPGGWSGEGAGILALLMGFLPLGLPDGKSSLTQETQTALLLMGALLMVLPLFASPIRDRRRRGPRGFATLALRPG